MKAVNAMAVCSFLVCLPLGQEVLQAKQPTMESDVLLTTMEQELRRGQAELAKQDPAPYFTSYTLSDKDVLFVIGSQGAPLTHSRE